MRIGPKPSMPPMSCMPFIRELSSSYIASASALRLNTLRGLIEMPRQHGGYDRHQTRTMAWRSEDLRIARRAMGGSIDRANRDRRCDLLFADAARSGPPRNKVRRL